MSVDHKGNVQPAIDNEEHEHYLEPATKRVLAYGFDGSSKQILKTDSGGKLEISGTISGGVSTVFQGGSWDIRSLNSSATIYAIVNTAAAGQASVVLDSGTKQIGSVTVSNPITIGNFSGSTIYAVTNSISGNVTLNPGPNQIGSVTVSNVVNSIVTVAPRTDYVGLVSVSGNVVNSAGANFIGLATVVNGAGTAYIGLASVNIGGTLPALAAGTAQLGSVTVSNVVNSIVTVAPRTDYIGLMSISGNVVNFAGTAQMGSVTISNVVNSITTIAPRTDYIGLTSVSGNVVNLAGTAQIGSVTVSNNINIGNFSGSTIYAVVNTSAAGQASVVLDAGTKQIGSVTVSNPITIGNAMVTVTLGTKLDYVNDSVSIGNFSGSTIYAVVNTSAAGQASVVLDTGNKWVGLATVVSGAGTAQLGSVTISNVVNSIVTVAPRTDYVGLVSVSGNVINLAGTAQIGSVTISNPITIGNFSGSTIYAVVNTSAAGQASVVLDAGVSQIGSVTISHPVSLGVGSATIGIISSVASMATIYAVVNTSAAGQASVVLDNSTATIGIVRLTPLVAGTAQVGSVTVSSIGAGTATIGIISSVASMATIYAVVNTSAAGQASVVLDNSTATIGIVRLTPLVAGTSQIGSVTVSNELDVRSLLSTATLFAVVNTGAPGVGESLVTINPRTDYIGLMSVSGNVAISGIVSTASIQGKVMIVDANGSNMDLWHSGDVFTAASDHGLEILGVSDEAPNKYRPLAVNAAGQLYSHATILNQPALVAGTAQIGMVTVSSIGVGVATVGIMRLTDPTTIWNGGGVVTINSINAGVAQIGSVTVSSIGVGVATIGTVRLTDPATVWSGGGLVTVNSINAGTAQIGSVTVSSIGVGTATIGIIRHSSLVAGSAYIGLATVNLGAGTEQVGSVTVSSIGVGTATIGIVRHTPLVAGSAYIGLATVNLGVGTSYIGLATVNLGVGSSFIGLATVVSGAGTAQMGSVTISNTVNALATTTSAFLSSNYTSFATVISSTGNSTLFTVPNGQRWVLKDLIIGSLGNSEVQLLSHTDVKIPYISLATKGGYISNFGDSGLRGNVSGAFVIALNGAATVGVSANVRFE